MKSSRPSATDLPVPIATDAFVGTPACSPTRIVGSCADAAAAATDSVANKAIARIERLDRLMVLSRRKCHGSIRRQKVPPDNASRIFALLAAVYWVRPPFQRSACLTRPFHLQSNPIQQESDTGHVHAVRH